MERNLDSSSLEVEFRFFTHDLEKGLGEDEDYFIRLGDKREVPEADSLIFDYIFNKVSITGTGWENANFNYLGKDVQNDFTFVYVEYTDIKSWGEAEITNKLLFEHFEGQSNQLSLIHNNKVITLETFEAYPTRTINLNP